MIHRKLGLVIKAEISIPLLKIMRSTDVLGIQIFSPNRDTAKEEKGYYKRYRDTDINGVRIKQFRVLLSCPCPISISHA